MKTKQQLLDGESSTFASDEDILTVFYTKHLRKFVVMLNSKCIWDGSYLESTVKNVEQTVKRLGLTESFENE